MDGTELILVVVAEMEGRLMVTTTPAEVPTHSMS